MGTQHKEPSTNYSITDFYKGKSIFLTGATGYLGTILLEKILFSCPDVKNIYALVKPDKGLSSRDRLEKLFNLEVFERIKEHNPEALKKVIPINGNITEECLGISKEDTALIQKEVSIIFHGAASVNFSLTLNETITTNTRSTVKVLQLARTVRNLEAFVYISTAYANCRRNNDVVDEKVYSIPTSPESAFFTLEHSPKKSNLFVNNLLGGRPNYYTYSKALTEHIIESKYNDLPIVIARPSIITSAMKEPIPGWTQGFSGANQVNMLIGKRMIRAWRGTHEAVFDVVPVDYVANFMIAVAWDCSRERFRASKTIKVFNYVSNVQNPLTLGEFLGITAHHSGRHYNYTIPPFIILSPNLIWYSILFFFLQTIPAYFIQGLCLLFGQKTRALKAHKSIIKLLGHLKFFTINQFMFVNRNVKELYEAMEENDRQVFEFNIKNVNWNNYLSDYALGLKKYLLRQ